METIIKRAKEEEGFVDHLYLCPKNKWTIGYGRNIQDVGLSTRESLALFGRVVPLKDQISFLKDRKITVQQATFLLIEDVTKAIYQALKHIPIAYKTCDDVRKTVLIDLIFNMGIFSVLKFKKMLLAIEKQDWELAAIELLDSNYAKKDVPQRANRNAKILRTGVLNG